MTGVEEDAQGQEHYRNDTSNNTNTVTQDYWDSEQSHPWGATITDSWGLNN